MFIFISYIILWSFSIKLLETFNCLLIFLVLFFVYILFLNNNLINHPLLIVYPHAIPLDIGMTINPNPVSDSVIELDVVARITNVSIGFNIVDNIFYFYFSFLIFHFYLWSL